jgi:hypothetical protein
MGFVMGAGACASARRRASVFPSAAEERVDLAQERRDVVAEREVIPASGTTRAVLIAGSALSMVA